MGVALGGRVLWWVDDIFDLGHGASRPDACPTILGDAGLWGREFASWIACFFGGCLVGGQELGLKKMVYPALSWPAIPTTGSFRTRTRTQ